MNYEHFIDSEVPGLLYLKYNYTYISNFYIFNQKWGNIWGVDNAIKEFGD